MPSNDNFWKESIDGNPEHHKYLNPDHYYENKGSPLRTFLTTTGIGTALFLGGRHAFRRGAFNDISKSFIKAMGRFRPTEADAILSSVKEWAKGPLPWDQYSTLKDKLLGSHGILGAGWEESMTELSNKIAAKRANLMQRGVTGGKLITDDLDIERRLRETERVMEHARTVDTRRQRIVQDKTKQFLSSYNEYTQEMRETDLRKYGMRRATVGDLWNHQNSKGALFNRNRLNSRDIISKYRVELGEQNLFNKMADPWVFIDEASKLHDLRYWPKVGKSVLNSMETDFGLPFVNFNPLAMFHVGDMLNVRDRPMIHLMSPDEIQPVLSGRESTKKLYLMLDDMLHDVEDASKAPIKGYLINAKVGPGRTFLQGISGAGLPKPEDYQYPTSGWRKHWAWFTRKLDIGHQQKDDYNREFDITNALTDIIAKPADMFWKHMLPYENRGLFSGRPFGSTWGRAGQEESETNWLFMRSIRYENPIDITKQFFAHRDRPEDTTTLSVPFYYFFSRLDAALATFRLGLSAEHRKSGADIFLNMVLRRAVPVWAGLEAWDYMNYETENLTGIRPDDMIAEGYSEVSTGIAKVKDVLGITDMAKQVKNLLPGGEQIAEFPLIGRFFDLDDTEEETEEFWEKGEVPIRKGRWWFMGNTPLTGSRTMYYSPNWVRRTKSHYEYTDTQYGSEGEYFANAPYPTPRYPLAPLRHFVTEPYHFEEKHYKDRPYLLTGGTPELEEFPLIGPLLNATIGQLLKPQRPMHPEVWRKIEGEDDTTVATEPKSYETPNDEYYNQQWGYKKIGAGPAIGTVMKDSHKESIVAVIDSGVDKDHPDLKGKILPGKSFAKRYKDFQHTEVSYAPWDEDTIGHGTHVTGTIAAIGDNKEGVAGVAWPSVKILPIKVFDSGGAPTEDVVKGIDYAIKWRGANGQKVDVINMSLGSPNINPGYSDAIKRAYNSGIVVVAASGNEYQTEHVGSPAIYPEAIAVGAVGPNMKKADFSNSGAGLDVVAPGVDIASTLPEDSQMGSMYGVSSGTSMATPHVAATAALLKTQRPDLTPAEIKFLIQSTAVDLEEDGWDKETGHGLVNAYTATSILSGMSDEERELIRKGGSLESEQINKERIALINAIRESGITKAAFETVGKSLVDKYNREIKNPVDTDMAILQTWENVKEFGGFYGFSTELLYDTGKGIEPQIATARAMSSYRREFWDTELGGIPGDINEIARRFIGHREKWENRYNPVPNTMPDWLPGEEYFTDFKTGDPYVKIRRGEMRLPGEAYESLHPDTAAEVEKALEDPEIRRKLEAGEIHRGELYGPISRFRILADVAPWSTQYDEASKFVTEMKKTKEQEQEVKEIRKQVKDRNDPIRLYPYRFKDKETKSETVTVTKVLDDWEDSHDYFFYTKEYPDNPIKLAGLRVPMSKEKAGARQFLNKYIKPGEQVTIEYTADDVTKINDDTYKTISAVVYTGNENLNRQLLEQDLANEKDNDFTPAGIVARFTPSERAMGQAWEKFAHLDTPFHTKLLQVRSPIESYKRRDLYGKDWQMWQDPWEDYVVPTYQSIMSKGMIVGGLFGGFMGYLAGRKRFGKIIATGLGAVLGGTGGAYFTGHEFVTGETWVPERRKKEWETHEYYDMLKYLKNVSLYNKYAQEALDTEKFDVKKYLQEKDEQKKIDSKRTNELESAKRDIKGTTDNVDVNEWITKLNLTGNPRDERELIKLINQELTKLKAPKKEEKLTPLAQKALDYYNESKSTMYGHKPQDPLKDLLRAIPKKERQYLEGFINATPDEREELRDIMSPYMKRIVQEAWGEKASEKQSLLEYFKAHFLPDPEWGGWREDVNLNNVKVKYIKAESMDPSEFDIWPDDEIAANEPNVPPAPKINIHETANTIKSKLQSILGGAGIDAEIQIEPNDTGQLSVEVETQRDIRQDIANCMNNYSSLVLG